MAYKSELERFDMERGNVLMIPRETCVELKEMQEDAAKVLVPLVVYVAGNPGDPIPEVEEADPRIKRILTGMLHRMIEHQRQVAAKYADRKAANRENALKRWHGDGEKCDGMPSHAIATSKGKGKEVEEGKQKEVFPSSTTSNTPPNKLGHAGDTPARAAAGDGLNAAPRGTARTATRVAYFDPLSGQIDAQTFDEAELRARPIDFMLSAIGEERDAQTRNALIKALEDLRPEPFAETCWRFIADMVKAENDCAAVLTKARENFKEKYGDKADEKLRRTLEAIIKTGSTNPNNDGFVIPWQKWRDYQPGRYLMAALTQARLAAGIPIKRKPGKRKGGEE